MTKILDEKTQLTMLLMKTAHLLGVTSVIVDRDEPIQSQTDHRTWLNEAVGDLEAVFDLLKTGSANQLSIVTPADTFERRRAMLRRLIQE